MKQGMPEVMELSPENLAGAQKKQLLCYDGGSRVREIKEGLQVLALLRTGNNKMNMILG